MKKFTLGVGAASAVLLGLAGACSNDEATEDDASTSSRSAASSTSSTTSTTSSTSSSTSSSTTSSTSASTGSNGGGGQGQGGEGGQGQGGQAQGGTAGAGGVGGSGGGSSAGEDCSSVLAAPQGTTSLDTTNLTDDYPSYTCGTVNVTAAGPDAVLSIAVPGGQYLAAAHLGGYDGVIVGYDVCDPTMGAGCVGGDDAVGNGVLEGFTHQNTTVNSQTIFLFTDGYGATDAGPVDVFTTVYDPAAGGDTCATAIPINKTAAQQTGGTSLLYSYPGFAADYTMTSSGCTGYSEPGLDVVFSIVLDTTDSLDVTLTPVNGAGDDIALYLLVGNCTNPEAECVAGADVGFGGDPETVTAYSPTANGTTVYIVADGWQLTDTTDAFLLNVVVQ